MLLATAPTDAKGQAQGRGLITGQLPSRPSSCSGDDHLSHFHVLKWWTVRPAPILWIPGHRGSHGGFSQLSKSETILENDFPVRPTLPIKSPQNHQVWVNDHWQAIIVWQPFMEHNILYSTGHMQVGVLPLCSHQSLICNLPTANSKDGYKYFISVPHQTNDNSNDVLSRPCPSPFTGMGKKGSYKKIEVTAERRAGCRPTKYRVLERFRQTHFVRIEGLQSRLLILLLA